MVLHSIPKTLGDVSFLLSEREREQMLIPFEFDGFRTLVVFQISMLASQRCSSDPLRLLLLLKKLHFKEGVKKRR